MAVMTVYVGLVGGAGLISPDGIDFAELSPLPLAVAMFVGIAVAYGAVMPWLTERMLRDGSVMRRGWTWIVGLLPLVAANIVGILVLLIAMLVLLVRRSAPSTIARVALTGRDVDRPNAARRDRVHQRRQPGSRQLRDPVVE